MQLDIANNFDNINDPDAQFCDMLATAVGDTCQEALSDDGTMALSASDSTETKGDFVCFSFSASLYEKHFANFRTRVCL